jgi:lipid-binding SYLF domain-containing protein
MATPDKGIPEEVLSNAKCILVVPDLIKGGSSSAGNTGVALLRAAPPAVGVRQHLFLVGGKLGIIRSAYEGVDLSCWS